MKQQVITESQLNEVIELVVSHTGHINIDGDDVRSVLSGKVGILFTATQSSENCQEFLQRSLREFAEQPAVRSCKYALLNIGMSPEDPLTMEDMDLIKEFLETYVDDEAELKWGLYQQPEGQKMTIHFICTNYLQ